MLNCIGGFSSVLLPDGTVALARLRGKLRRQGEVVAGDRVWVVPVGPSLRPELEGGEASQAFAAGPATLVIEEVLARRTFLPRPPVANVDQVLAVISLADPPPALELLDRLIVVALREGVEPLICFSKADLVDASASRRLVEGYRRCGLRAVAASARDGTGLDELRSLLQNRVSILAGPSGAGKSTLLNALVPGASRPTGEISSKTRRGRHTTRAVELLRLPTGGVVADSPGFARLDLTGIEPRKLQHYFPEFAELASGCTYRNCLHREEPGCQVREELAGEEGVPGLRYRHYRLFLDEVERLYEDRYS
ncbi:MAG: ribosome small subunit-dependent GTPase A [Limnochordales bacterium]|nr:ribosome small subunit-dependent GTPase A [Limnochordales bacterium]